MDRRTFTRLTTLAAAGMWSAPGELHGAGTPRADLVLRGATLFDGTGAPGRELDVAITGSTITAVGRRLPAGGEEVDLRGLALAPGFIDVHSHADLSLLVNPKAESRVRQGVTTEVVGQDGGSVGPWSEERFREVRATYARSFEVDIDVRDPAGFLERIDRERPAVNVASMVGNGALRALVVGTENRPATAEEVARMRTLLRDLLDAGCVGLSSGLEYTPSGFASTDELTELARELRGRGLPYASHLRNEDDRLLGAVEEALMVGKLAGVPVQLSHLKQQGMRNYWKADAVLALVEEARREGIDVMFDVYPYIAYQTGLSNLFPTNLRAGGSEAFLARLRDPQFADALEAACRTKVALLGGWDRVQIARSTEGWALGRRVSELAEMLDREPYEVVVELLESNGGSVGMIGYGMSEENVARLLAHPSSLVCSDGGAYAPYGPLSDDMPHPRSYGTFPRVFARYVRERGDLELAEAVYKCTLGPARRVGLRGRGRVAPGWAADLVAFDPDTIRDRATFEDPHQYPEGIEVVVVNGVVTLRGGEQTGARGGRGLRAGGGG